MYFSIKNINSEDNHAFAMSIKYNLIFWYTFLLIAWLFWTYAYMRNVKGHSAVIEMYVLLGTIVSLLTNLLTRLTTDNTLLILIIAFSYTLTAFLNYFNVN